MKSALPSLFVNSFVGALVFSLYAASIEYQRDKYNIDVDNAPLSHFYAGGSFFFIFAHVIVAGISLPLLSTPLQVLLNVSKTQKTFILSSVEYVFKYHGLSFLYRGTLLSFFRDCFGFSLFFGSFASVKYLCQKYSFGMPYEQAFHVVLAGGIAGVLNHILSSPIEEFVNVMIEENLNYVKTWKKIIQYEGGWRKFLFKDLNISLTRVFPSSALAFLVFEIINQNLDLEEERDI